MTISQMELRPSLHISIYRDMRSYNSLRRMSHLLVAGAEMVAAFSVVPPMAWALVKKGEHDMTGKIIKGLTGHH